MKIPTYAEILSTAKDALKEAMIPVRARKTRANAEIAAANIDSQILSKQERVLQLLGSEEVNFDAVVDELDNIALLEMRKERYQEVLSQLFPDKAATTQQPAKPARK